MARILIIDDDAQHREIIKLRIQKATLEGLTTIEEIFRCTAL